ncbi:putative cysteine protease [Dishui Lake virophage 8]|nr:putative cysteine protease [Dishui Lake virophage 5]QIG59416.1 putative cysteine protease [Dishui Lake virophage 8]
MPYDIRKVEDGFKVCKKGTKKCYSKDPLPLKRAIAQRKAIGMSGGKMNIDQEVYIDKKFKKGFTIHTNTEKHMDEVVSKLKGVFGSKYFEGLNYKRPNKELAEKESLLAGCFWYEMPEYKVNDKQLDRYSFMLYYDKQDKATNEKLSKIFGVEITPVSTFAWYPKFPEDLTEQSKTKMYITEPVYNKTKYPIYIISKGRWEKRHTSRYLDWADIPYKIVVEPQEKQNYIDSGIPESKILILPKEYLGLNQGGIPARNFVWNHSVSIGAKRHWILDDNIRGYYRLNNNQRTLVKGGVAFKVVEDYVDRFENIKMAGHNYAMFGVATFLKPITKNTRIYSSILISNDLKDILDEKWRGRYNEDVDLSIRVLKKGYATCLFNALLAGKLATMTQKGGNTDTIYSEGSYEKAMRAKVEHLRKQHPDIVSVYHRFGRTHHLVDYGGFKDIEYKLKPSIKLKNKTDNFGMRLVPKEKIPSLTGGDYFDDEDFIDLDLEEQDDTDYLQDKKIGGDIDWWGIAKDIGSDLWKQGKEYIVDNYGTEEQKEAKRKKEEACRICNEGSGMSGGAIPIDKAKYEKAKEIVYPRYKKPSAYRSGAVIKKYKELGGRFKDDGERKLKRWFQEEWKDWGNKEYPVYRPSKRITKDTPLTPSEIDPENMRQQIEIKQKIKGEKNLKPFVKKGGALYAKDKYETSEKGLTPVEKAKVKKTYGENNPDIAEIVEEPMGDDDIKKYFPNAKILKYSELRNYSDITQLLPKPKSFFFLLYERTLNVGHWVLVSRYKDNGIDTIEFFCSYGSKIDAPLTWTPIGMRVQLGQDKPYLSMLLDKSKFRVIYNPVQYQSKKSKVATCGAYDTLRAGELVRHNTTLDEFTEMLEDVKKATGLSYDEIVANLVDLR